MLATGKITTAGDRFARCATTVVSVKTMHRSRYCAILNPTFVFFIDRSLLCIGGDQITFAIKMHRTILTILQTINSLPQIVTCFVIKQLCFSVMVRIPRVEAFPQ